jgi:hypothetical protein
MVLLFAGLVAGAQTPAVKPDESMAAKITRAQRRHAPDWITKTAWREDHGGRIYLYGVGRVQGIADPALRVSAAEDRARAEIVRFASPASTGTQSEGTLSGSKPVDWYARKSDGSFFALVVVKR